MKTLRFCAVALVVVSGIATAQSRSQVELARQIALVVANDPADIMRTSFDAMTPSPAATAMREAVTAFYAKYLPRDTVVSITAHAYLKAFDERELREILAWISTPLGKRFIAGQPQIARDAQSQLAALLAPHQDELRQVIQGALVNRPPEPDS